MSTVSFELVTFDGIGFGDSEGVVVEGVDGVTIIGVVEYVGIDVERLRMRANSPRRADLPVIVVPVIIEPSVITVVVAGA